MSHFESLGMPSFGLPARTPQPLATPKFETLDAETQTDNNTRSTDNTRNGDSMQSTYTVTGMTCGHCVMHITNEVKAVPGVEDVLVTLEDGRMVITSAAPIDFGKVSEAVSEAGDYQVAVA